jgi:hypothetical protein
MNYVKTLIELVVKILLLLYNKIEQKRLKKEIKTNKENIDEVLQDSYQKYHDLMDEYDRYLVDGTSTMRSDTEEVHRDGESPASDTSTTGKSDKGSRILN